MTGSFSTHGFRRLGLAFGAACTLLAASGPALACNPFELLFGGCRETQAFRPDVPAYYEPAVPGASRMSAAKPKARLSHAAPANSNGVSGKQKPIAASADAPVGSLALFEKDRTLRTGDVVVTNTGFRVYEGRGAFAPIAQDGGRLATLEKVSFARKPSGSGGVTTTESVVAGAPEATALARPSPFGLRTQARAASAARIVASGG